LNAHLNLHKLTLRSSFFNPIGPPQRLTMSVQLNKVFIYENAMAHTPKGILSVSSLFRSNLFVFKSQHQPYGGTVSKQHSSVLDDHFV